MVPTDIPITFDKTVWQATLSMACIIMIMAAYHSDLNPIHSFIPLFIMFTPSFIDLLINYFFYSFMAYLGYSAYRHTES